MSPRAALVLVLALSGCTRTIPADVRAFVAKVRETRLDPNKHDPRALQFYEESEVLRERYASVCRWPSLEAVRRELAQYLNEHPPDLSRWQDKIAALRRDCAGAAAAGRFAESTRRLDEFGARFGEERNAELAAVLDAERELLDRRAVAWARRRCADAHYERYMGRKDDARRILRGAFKDLSGFDDAREVVSKALSEMPE